jgi:GT2 family glycosyltransferase
MSPNQMPQIRNPKFEIRNSPKVTIVVVPRERFSYTSRSLESIYEHTDIPFSLVYVDGGSPGRIKRYLAQQARLKNFKLIRTEHYLSPNQARNLGFQQIETKYVVFVDNDVLVSPGWLKALVDCAEETDAWVVGALTLVGKEGTQEIHAAGGSVAIKEEEGRRVFVTNHGLAGESVDRVASELCSQETELVEFHCMLVLAEACRQAGPLDEQLFSVHEHEDFCLIVRELGGSVYFEPRSIITYVAPPPFAWSDLPFFMLRWSELWNSDSQQRFQEKWRLGTDDWNVTHTREWAREHRLIPLSLVRRITRRLSRACGWPPGRIEQACLLPLEDRINRCLANPRALLPPDAKVSEPSVSTQPS